MHMSKHRQNPATAKVGIERIGRNGYLHRVIPIVDKSGNVIEHVVKPLMVEFRARDAFQTIIGAAILAVPAAYTEETWDLGRDLPLINIIGVAIVSIAMISAFVYYNFYRKYMGEYRAQYVLRVCSTYLISLGLVATILTLIQQCPWGIDNMLAIKRIVIVSLPASMGGTISDSLK